MSPPRLAPQCGVLSAFVSCPGPETVVAYLGADRDATARGPVEQHIDGCPSCRKLVAVLAASGATRGLDDGAPLPLPLPPDDLGQVGRYELREVVGVGAMGIVYRAHDPRLDREVALKVLRRREPAAADDMLAEANALAAIDHPNVVDVYDVGTHEDAVYIAMELVAGRTLRELVATEPPGWSRVLEHVLDAARGLAAIHDAGLVHCDIKPDNVLVGDDGRVLVVDLGLAAQRGAPRELRTATRARGDIDETTSAMLVGTPVYMAAELLDGEAPTATSDQLALCVTAFELLHGVRPFRGANIEVLRAATLAGNIEVRRRAEIPRAVDATLERGLRPDPALRWPDVRALIDALEVAVRPGPARWPWVAAGVAALGAVAWSFAPPTEPVPTEVQACPIDIAVADQWKAHGKGPRTAAAIGNDRPSAPAVAAQLAGGVARWAQAWSDQAEQACTARARDPVRFIARQSCLMQRRVEFEGLLKSLDDPTSAGPAIDRLLRLGPPVCLQSGPSSVDDAARSRLAEIRMANWTARHDDALDGAEHLLDELAAVEDAAFVAAVRAERGRAMIGRGQADAGIKVLQQAVLDARAAGDDERVAQEGAALVVAMVQLGRADDSARWLRHAEAAATSTGSVVARAAVDFAAGSVAHRRREFESARERFAAALRLYTEMFGPDGAGTFEVVAAMMRLSFDEGDIEAARKGCDRVLAIARNTWGPGHPETAGTIANMAPILAATGQAQRARELLESSLQTLTARFGDTHPMAGLSHLQLGVLAGSTDDIQGAVRHLEACVHAFRKQPTTPSAITCRLNLAQMQAFTGHCDRALVHYSGLVQAFEAVGAGDEYRRELALALIGQAHCRLEAQPRHTISLLERVETLAPAIDDPTMLPDAMFMRARALWQVGDRADAIDLAQRVSGMLHAPIAGELDPEIVSIGALASLRDDVDAWLAEHDGGAGQRSTTAP